MKFTKAQTLACSNHNQLYSITMLEFILWFHTAVVYLNLHVTGLGRSPLQTQFVLWQNLLVLTPALVVQLKLF